MTTDVRLQLRRGGLERFNETGWRYAHNLRTGVVHYRDCNVLARLIDEASLWDGEPFDRVLFMEFSPMLEDDWRFCRVCSKGTS